MKKAIYPSGQLRNSITAPFSGKTSQVLPGYEARLKPVRSEPTGTLRVSLVDPELMETKGIKHQGSLTGDPDGT